MECVPRSRNNVGKHCWLSYINICALCCILPFCKYARKRNDAFRLVITITTGYNYDLASSHRVISFQTTNTRRIVVYQSCFQTIRWKKGEKTLQKTKLPATKCIDYSDRSSHDFHTRFSNFGYVPNVDTFS